MTPNVQGEPGKRTIVALLAGFTVIWTLYFWITEAPVAIKHDMAEAYAWGHEFQWGYHQHPPFWAWICGLWFSVFPRTGWAFALLSSANAAIGLWGAWTLIGDFAAGVKRRSAWLLLLLTPLYTFYAYKYNANIIFLSIWPWACHGFMKSLRGRSAGDAIAFGVLAGIAMMSKYYAVILLATCLLTAIQHPLRRKYFASASPFVSASVAAAICAPHVVWLLHHRAPPLEYLAGTSGQTWGAVAGYVAETISDVVGMTLGVFLPAGWVAYLARRDRSASVLPRHNPEIRMIATMALAPLIMTIACALLLRTRITAEMPIGTFALLPLLVLELTGTGDSHRLHRASLLLAGALTFGALAVAPGIALARIYLNAKSVAPFQEVALTATTLWHERTGRPLQLVGGSDWYENEIAFYGPDRPSTFVQFDFSRNLWVTPDSIGRTGLLSVCISDDRICLAATAKFVTAESSRTEVTLAHTFWGHVSRPVHFVITIIPPRA